MIFEFLDDFVVLTQFDPLFTSVKIDNGDKKNVVKTNGGTIASPGGTHRLSFVGNL